MAGVALWAWHAPVLCNAALAREDIHIAEHLCFMVTAAIFKIDAPCAGRRKEGVSQK
jgi:cytochrome c oxidase assembly factor CtaG